ncbi:MAG: hypothetical protein NWF06_11235, partial [Candidatus Bathyarchaeota archaeon]|nr:hypothetical protein [Candidatus Bathyarchaeum sp.]
MARERKNKLFAVFAMFALCAMVLPQTGIMTIMPANASSNPTTEWTQTYGGALIENIYDLIETSDDGFALVGYTSSFGAGDSDFWLIKTDASGNEQWNKTYGGFDTERSYAIIETTVTPGFAIVGYTESYGAGDDDVWLVRTDADGNMLWNMTYGGVEDEQGNDLVETSDGGFAIVGYTETWVTGDDDAWLVKADASGNVQWNMSYGGVEDEQAEAIITTSDGGFIFTGTTETWSAGSRDLWLVKTDASGNVQWNMSHGYSDSDYGYDLLETTDGCFVVTGQWDAGDYNDAWLVKADASGSFLWEKTYGSSLGDDYLFNIVKTMEGGYAMAGYTKSYGAGNNDVWLVETDVDGNMLWNQTWGGTEHDNCNSLIATSDTGYLLGGFTKSFGDLTDADGWLIKVAVDHPVVSSAEVGVLVDYGDGT